MKHLLRGVAVSAVLAIATTVWAQAPSTPPSTMAPPATSSATPPSGAATAAPAASDKITRRLAPPPAHRCNQRRGGTRTVCAVMPITATTLTTGTPTVITAGVRRATTWRAS